MPLSCVITNTIASVGAHAKKFNIVKNNHEHTQRCEFSVLDQKHRFHTNFSKKMKTVSPCWNLSPKSNMQNSMVMFTFSVFDQKYPFWVNLVQEIKIVCLSRNLVSILIWMCKIQRWYLFHFIYIYFIYFYFIKAFKNL